MLALSRKMLEHQPGEIALLLPWYVTGTLNPRDMQRVEQALAVNPELARQYAAIQREYAEIMALNESLGAPTMRAMQKLFAAIDAAPARRAALRGLRARIMTFLMSLSPRMLAWSVSLGALLVLVQAAVIGALLLKSPPATLQTASLSPSERAQGNVPLTGPLGPVAAPMHALVRFAPEARVADITTLLDTYQASIVGGAEGGLFRLQFGDRAITTDEADRLIARLQREHMVSLAVAAPQR